MARRSSVGKATCEQPTSVVRRGDGKFAKQWEPEHKGALGRPSTYRKRYARAAALLVQNGASDAQVADFFGITQRTLGDWRARHKELAQALVGDTSVLTPFVERSFFHRAVGFEREGEKVFYDREAREVVRVPVREYYPPDVAAGKHWLEKCGHERWAPSVQRVDVRMRVAAMSDEELAQAVLRAREVLALVAPERGAE